MTRLVHGLLDEAAARFSDHAALSDPTGVWTYAELADRSRRAAGWLRERGVGAGDRVVLRLPGGRAMAALLFGALRLGAAVVPLNPATGPFHLRWILEDAEPALVVEEPQDLEGEPVGAPPVDPAGTALLLYTSGSTAMPRAVICPHERVRFAVDAIAARLRYRADDVVFSRIPLSFDYGLYQLFLCAAAGARLALRPDLVEAATLRETRSVGATVLPVVPTLAALMPRLAQRDPGPTRVRLLTNTGADLSPALAAGLRSAFPDAVVVPMYGMTECKRITIAEPDEDLAYPGSVGRALDGTEVRVVDGAGRPVAAGTVGEIQVSGPHVMTGYWRDPQASAVRFAGSTLRTGDYGWLDDGGRLYFAGRRDDIFKRKSVRMSTHEVEAALLDVSGVRAAAVLPPAPDGVLLAWVVGEVTPARVLAELARRVEPARVPDRCHVVAELPTTTNGKVDKHALKSTVDGYR
jgi:acyl-CoA synthetase (AMP-forming)/AMP-acid ligase II